MGALLWTTEVMGVMELACYILFWYVTNSTDAADSRLPTETNVSSLCLSMTTKVVKVLSLFGGRGIKVNSLNAGNSTRCELWFRAFQNVSNLLLHVHLTSRIVIIM